MKDSPITLEALSVLDAIESRGSFAKAAEQLNKVPSALSYIVQKLEGQLEVTLFVRQGRRSVLTPAGKYLLTEGRKVLNAINQITEQTQIIAHGWEPSIRIAYDSILDISLLYSELNTFLLEHPNIEIDLREEVMNGGWEALINDQVDLLIGAPAPIPNHQGIRAVKLTTLELLLVVKKGHALTKLVRPIFKADINAFRTIVVHDSAKQATPWSANIMEQTHHFYVASIEQKIHAIKAGIGIGYLPRNRIEKQLANGDLVAIDSDSEPVFTDIYAAWKVVNKGKGLQKLQAAIIKQSGL